MVQKQPTDNETYFSYGVDFESRTVFLYGDIAEDTMQHIIKAIIKMDNKEDTIKVYISSYGGEMHEMFALYDTIKAAKSLVETHTLGKSMSAAVLISACGDKGNRYAYANSLFMLHDSATDPGQGSHTYHEKELKSYKEVNDRWMALLVENSKMSLATIKKLCTSKGSEYFWADKALEYGLIDFVL